MQNIGMIGPSGGAGLCSFQRMNGTMMNKSKVVFDGDAS